MTISKVELRDITQEAELAFWEVVVKRFPQAQTGDLSIDRTIRLSIAAQEAVEEWIENNVPTATKYEETMFDKQTHWTDSPCYYVIACSRLRRASLAGPYPTAGAAEDVVPRARRWGIRQSGDRHATTCRYEVIRHFNGDTHSILGILTP